MSDLTEELSNERFTEYVATMSRLRTAFAEGNPPVLDEDNFIRLMRPYFWYSKEDGFVDIYQPAQTALAIIEEYETDLYDSLEMSGLPKFLLAYVAENRLEDSGWFMRASSVEMIAAIDLNMVYKKLLEKDRITLEIDTLAILARKFRKMDAAKHDVHYILGQIGHQYSETLSMLIPDLSSDDQASILEALSPRTP